MILRIEASIVEASVEIEVGISSGWRIVRIEGARLGLVHISVERKFMLGINDGSRKVSTRSIR